MAFIRKVKTASGATAIQIATKQKGQIVKIIHIGSAHTKEELAVLLALARKQLQGDQLELLPEPQPSLRVGLKRSFSGLLWDTLQDQYEKIGFNRLKDEAFKALCLARIVEPTSKIDTLRVLADLGVDPIDQNKLYHDQNFIRISTGLCVIREFLLLFFLAITNMAGTCNGLQKLDYLAKGEVE